jgi:hypothetical protein
VTKASWASFGFVVLALASCSATTIDGIKQPLRGPITALSTSNVCVGGPAASGDCFTASAAQLRGLRVNECVVAHWRSGGDPGAAPDVLISVKPRPGSAPDC